MQLFRNVVLFRFPLSALAEIEAIESQLETQALRPLGAMEMSTRGFVSPFGRGESQSAHRVGRAVLVTLGGEDKILPAAVVNEELANKLDRIREEEGRVPGGRERKRIKDEVLIDLLPRAFTRPTRTSAYLDLDLAWCVIDTASRKAAETVISVIREAIGSFPAVPANAEGAPRALLTSWIAGEALPEGFALGDECELIDPVDGGAVIKCRRQDLETDEIREHLKTGKQAIRVSLVFDDRLSFVMGDDLVIRKLKFTEIVTESLEQGQHESLREEADAVFALMSAELRVLLRRLEEVFALSKVE
ncbi:MAG: recombination-associated protein RdgC [Xanthomonadales bacterium]|nr:recombination-associated protein RdgC [Xanthomonadales bacterium]